MENSIFDDWTPSKFIYWPPKNMIFFIFILTQFNWLISIFLIYLF